jgi:hypothetical protein
MFLYLAKVGLWRKASRCSSRFVNDRPSGRATDSPHSTRSQVVVGETVRGIVAQGLQVQSTLR